MRWRSRGKWVAGEGAGALGTLECGARRTMEKTAASRWRVRGAGDGDLRRCPGTRSTATRGRDEVRPRAISPMRARASLRIEAERLHELVKELRGVGERGVLNLIEQLQRLVAVVRADERVEELRQGVHGQGEGRREEFATGRDADATN